MRIGIGILAVMVAGALVAGAFLASPELRAFAADTVTSLDIVDGTILSADIGTGQVKSSDIGANAVLSGKIKDGEVKTQDLATGSVTDAKVAGSFMVHRILFDDAAGNAAGWNPNGTEFAFFISDPAFDPQKSTVFLNVDDDQFYVLCGVDLRGFQGGNNFEVVCVGEPSEGTRLDYVIVTMPSTPMPASASASSITSEDVKKSK
jgi:hypothetical protein